MIINSLNVLIKIGKDIGRSNCSKKISEIKRWKRMK